MSEFLDMATEAFERCGIPADQQSPEGFHFERVRSLIIGEDGNPAPPTLADGSGNPEIYAYELFPIPRAIVIGGGAYDLHPDGQVIAQEAAYDRDASLVAGPRTIIRPTARIMGRVTVGSNCDMGGILYEATVGDAVIAAAQSNVQYKARVGTGSTLEEGATLHSEATLQDGMVASRLTPGHPILMRAGVAVGHNTQVGLRTTVGSGSTLEGGVHVGTDVTVGAGSTIGVSSRVADFASLGESVRLGYHGTVEEKARIGDAVILEDSAKVGEGASVGNRTRVLESASVAAGKHIAADSIVLDDSKYAKVYQTGQRWWRR